MRLPLCVIGLAFGGCEALIRQVAPPNFDFSSPADLAGTGPSNAKFNPDIQNDINMLGCAVPTCHGANAPLLANNPTDAQSIMMNYTAFALYAGDGANSPVLVLNVPITTHTGGPKLVSPDSDVYKRWLGWIEAGRKP